MTDSLDCSVFEAHEFPDGSFKAMSIGTNANGKRLSVTFSCVGVFTGLNSIYRKVSDIEWVDNNTHLDDVVTHFTIKHSTEYKGQEAVELGFLPCRPSSYPTESFDVITLSKSNDELWAIGHFNNVLYVFYKKNKRYGDYWIPQVVDSKVSSRDRIQEKLDDGYLTTINSFVFDHKTRNLEYCK
ncbi:hypothetical protein I6E85_11655 [Pseudoalteromonas sp. NZS71]|uniref:hypothetical protein n=1 Tax=unclassified Pseudoalteromonas TaxID=194690 RepID=UPI0004247C76|nr:MULTISPECIES: hypothetical protein [unclassified Pseudoalteromonas]MBH0061813.1 hypothetical protein [Pseudoalteromonas sp. NZS71]